MNKRICLLTLGTLFVFFALHRQAQGQSEDAPRFEVGAQFTSLTIREPAYTNDFRTEPGFGGRFTINLTDYLAAEAQADFFPNDNGRQSAFTGGRTTSAFFGVKTGKRFERFGIYGKARPGFVRFARTLTGLTVSTDTAPSQFPIVTPQFRGRTEFAMDIGGVLEFYPARRIVTRFDIGDTIIRFEDRTIIVPVFTPDTPTAPLTPLPVSGATKHNFQFSAGIGFRF